MCVNLSIWSTGAPPCTDYSLQRQQNPPKSPCFPQGIAINERGQHSHKKTRFFGESKRHNSPNKYLCPKLLGQALIIPSIIPRDFMMIFGSANPFDPLDRASRELQCAEELSVEQCRCGKKIGNCGGPRSLTMLCCRYNMV